MSVYSIYFTIMLTAYACFDVVIFLVLLGAVRFRGFEVEDKINCIRKTMAVAFAASFLIMIEMLVILILLGAGRIDGKAGSVALIGYYVLDIAQLVVLLPPALSAIMYDRVRNWTIVIASILIYLGIYASMFLFPEHAKAILHYTILGSTLYVASILAFTYVAVKRRDSQLTLNYSSPEKYARNWYAIYVGAVLFLLFLQIANAYLSSALFSGFYSLLAIALMLFITIKVMSFRYAAPIVIDDSVEECEKEDVDYGGRIKEALSDKEFFLKPDVTIADLSAVTGVQLKPLYRWFKSQDTTFHRTITELRIQQSVKLLAEGEKIEAIAYDCGFAEVRTFNRNFAAVMGCNPSEWRKKHPKTY